MAANDKTGSPPLDVRIDELESLLHKPAQASVAHDNIPVLDEEVQIPIQPQASSSMPAAVEKLTPRQLADLGQRLQQRVDAELEDLADIIRGVVKRCILEELRKELPPITSRSGDTSAAPNTHKPGPA